MYFIGVFVLSWLCFLIKANKSRVRELFGVAIWSSLLGLLTDLIMVEYQLWSYSGLPYPVYTIPLLLDFSIYPVVTYLYVQSQPENWRSILIRVLIWSSFATLFEWVTLKTGTMKHHGWWSLWLSFTADIVIFLSITGIYRFYRPAYINNDKQNEHEQAPQG